MQNIWAQSALVILGGFLAACGGIIVAIFSDKLTQKREIKSAIDSRKRAYLAFLLSWKYEFSRWYLVTGGLERDHSAFANVVSEFIAQSAIIKSDLPEDIWDKFDSLCTKITSGKIPNIQTEENYNQTVNCLNEITALVDSHRT